MLELHGEVILFVLYGSQYRLSLDVRLFNHRSDRFHRFGLFCLLFQEFQLLSVFLHYFGLLGEHSEDGFSVCVFRGSILQRCQWGGLAFSNSLALPREPLRRCYLSSAAESHPRQGLRLSISRSAASRYEDVWATCSNLILDGLCLLKVLERVGERKTILLL